ncbi:putative F-box protein At5g55150 [Humulus lupulus]|uniref:putative F-box protein At5g55150 n=1 Tax=Humulus lupulus TaxID=3486 RepID=UPI002B4036FD|nr:putative F-box protein At5g55150 [Humulus lupulus]
MDPDWADLPNHILDLIFEKMKTTKDCLTFGAICIKWYHICLHNRTKLIKLNRHQEPKLLFPNESKANDSWRVYSINSQHKKSLQSKLLLPSYDKPFAGSSEGWLATLDKNLAVTLYKPFLENNNETSIVHLPPLFPPTDLSHLERIFDHRDVYLLKFTTFTPDPISNPNDFIMVVLYGELCHLAYIRTSKDAATWIHVASSSDICFDDVIYYNNRFYVLLYETGGLASLDVSYDSSQPNLKMIVSDTPKNYNRKDRYFCYKTYLVESYKGELLQVQRYREDCDDHVTKEFEVFKFSFDRCEWVKINYLEEEALFVGDNTSISVDTSSSSSQCKSNCIYFVDDKDTTSFGSGPKDMGVYNLKTGSLLRRFDIDEKLFTTMGGRIPIWVLRTVFNTNRSVKRTSF